VIPVPSPGPPLRLAAREEVLPVVQQAAIPHLPGGLMAAAAQSHSRSSSTRPSTKEPSRTCSSRSTNAILDRVQPVGDLDACSETSSLASV
jgi:hypothetical protein